MDEKQLFSARLRAALAAAGVSERPGDLEKLFNLKYAGRPVTFQAVRYWLMGKTIPTQDKVDVLADLLEVDPYELRFGRKGDRHLAEPRLTWPASRVDARDRIAMELYQKLSDPHRKAVRDLIHALAAGS
jgi:transcriptional regulator with XRE-family HTH domain